jgi:hypothetical protein
VDSAQPLAITTVRTLGSFCAVDILYCDDLGSNRFGHSVRPCPPNWVGKPRSSQLSMVAISRRSGLLVAARSAARRCGIRWAHRGRIAQVIMIRPSGEYDLRCLQWRWEPCR